MSKDREPRTSAGVWVGTIGYLRLIQDNCSGLGQDNTEGTVVDGQTSGLILTTLVIPILLGYDSPIPPVLGALVASISRAVLVVLVLTTPGVLIVHVALIPGVLALCVLVLPIPPVLVVLVAGVLVLVVLDPPSTCVLGLRVLILSFPAVRVALVALLIYVGTT